MSLRDISVKKAYSSDLDDVLEDFYIPALGASLEYSRLAGFFSSASLAIAARGIVGLVANGGRLRLIASPRLRREDVDAILRSHEVRGERVEAVMVRELDRLAEQLIGDHVQALAWMIANGRLEIKVAIARDPHGGFLSYPEALSNAVFHQKVGILRDSEGDVITFSGSLNETASAWQGNIEEFKVFRSWQRSEASYVEADVGKFERFWNNRSQSVSVMDVPSAVKERLIEMAPQDFPASSVARWQTGSRTAGIQLFEHQQEALRSWVEAGMKGVFEMATGTGKTFAALGCLDRVATLNAQLATVIACPYQHLSQQWVRELGKFGIRYDQLIIADSSNPGWKHELADALMDLSLGHKSIVIAMTTHSTFPSKAFRGILQDHATDVRKLLIADEVHGLGATKAREGLLDLYDFRLGLSATPRRWFDELGTAAIFDHFGPTVYQFTLEDAITSINPATGQTYLAPYRYEPRFVALTDEELDDYLAKTRALARLAGGAKKDEQKDELLQNLLFRRADIVKAAARKYRALEEILDLEGASIKWTIVYCSPQQIDRVMSIIGRRGIVCHRFTMEEGTAPERRYGGVSERDFLLRRFAEGDYQILVAMRCLDEGVDVPPARTAVLMASSGNPRERIQRIGRVIRRYPGKTEATIYDILVTPSLQGMPTQLREMEWRIFEKELERCEEIAATAMNSAEALASVYAVKEGFMEAGK